MNADRVKIQQVLINLMQNACDAMMETACPQVLIDSIVDDSRSDGLRRRYRPRCIARSLCDDVCLDRDIQG